MLNVSYYYSSYSRNTKEAMFLFVFIFYLWGSKDASWKVSLQLNLENEVNFCQVIMGRGWIYILGKRSYTTRVLKQDTAWHTGEAFSHRDRQVLTMEAWLPCPQDLSKEGLGEREPRENAIKEDLVLSYSPALSQILLCLGLTYFIWELRWWK